jgi:hypothetical protein
MNKYIYMENVTRGENISLQGKSDYNKASANN